jgi:CRISPR system Cascade subunit CasB
MANEAKQAGAFVKYKIEWISKSANDSAVRATLAKLRRGIGKEPGSLPELWSITLEGLPLEMLGEKNSPTHGERAVYTALTLFALHQQGKDLKNQCMSKEREFLGYAVRKLVDKSNEEAVSRRFHAAAMADSFEALVWHLRGLISLLRSKEIPLDYPALTQDLYWYQIHDMRDGIRLNWGRDFYRNQVNETVSDTLTARKDGH